MFSVVHESDIDDTQFLNFLVGKLTVPEKTFVFNCKAFPQSTNSEIMI